MSTDRSRTGFADIGNEIEVVGLVEHVFARPSARLG
jgi:hypothetical protein